MLAYIVGWLLRAANEEVRAAPCQAHSGPPVMLVEWMRAKRSSINVFYKCSILMISGSFHTEGSAKEVHGWQPGLRPGGFWLCWTKQIRIHLFGAIETVPASSKMWFHVGGVPGSSFTNHSGPCLFPAPSLSPCRGCYLPLKELPDVSQNQAPDVWKTLADKVINLFGGQMLSENFPATALWVSKFIRNIN